MWSPPVQKSEPANCAEVPGHESAAASITSGPSRPVSHRRSRRGAAIIEFALLAPVLFMLVLGMIEFGRVLMVAQLLTDAAREGGRLAVVAGSNTDKVTSTVDSFLTNAGVNGAHTSVSPDPSAANKFMRMVEAYKILRDPDKRKKYDLLYADRDQHPIQARQPLPVNERRKSA